jgi:O-antigen/teichoic acid export membrane protein
MFVAMRSVLPATFGEFSYFQASVAALVALCGLGLDASSNALISRARSESRGYRSIIVAGLCAVGASTLVLAILLVGFWLLDRTVGVIPLLLIFLSTSLQLLTVLFTGVLVSSRWSVSAASLSVFVSVAFLASTTLVDSTTQGTHLLAMYVAAQAVAVAFGAYRLLGIFRACDAGEPRQSVGKVLASLISYGAKNSVIAGSMLVGQWALQARIIGEAGGAEENAVYGLANQVYSIVIFAPYVAGPLLMRRMASCRTNQDASHLALRWGIVFLGLVAVGLVALAIGFPLVSSYLPNAYQRALVPVLLSAVAAGFQFIKAPYSVYFQSRLVLYPEVLSALVAAAAIYAGVVLLDRMDAQAAAGMRAVAHGLQLLIVTAFFLWLARRGANSALDRSAEWQPET